MTKIPTPYQARLRRHRRVRRKVCGTGERPRLNVFRSLNHTYAQVIDDAQGVTLVAASTRDLSSEDGAGGTKTESARRVGELLAERAHSVGVAQVVFDRGGYRYHGRVRALAEGARAKGLQF